MAEVFPQEVFPDPVFPDAVFPGGEEPPPPPPVPVGSYRHITIRPAAKRRKASLALLEMEFKAMET